MIRLGIIGTDASGFDGRYLSLLEQLRDQVQIAAVYDSVLVHAQRIAEKLDAQVCDSYQQLANRSDIHGLLMFSPVWAGCLPVQAAMRQNKPLFCTQSVWDQILDKQPLEELYQETAATVVVESQCRYWPTILRARELQATELGQPQELLWQLNSEAVDGSDSLRTTISSVLDGICFLIQRLHIKQTEQSSPENSHAKRSLSLQFNKKQDSPDSDSIPVRILPVESLASYQIRIRCERGTLEIHSPIEMSWKIGDQSFQEQLSEEQSGTARQIDHFCRHIAGGLIPLHNLTNALWNDRQSDWLYHLLAKKM